MYRTDKKFMKDPATASSRIYIGGLSETVVPDMLDEKFKVHGKILGLVLQRTFGFIQYENDSQAQAAIRNENGVKFCGRKLVVKQAVDKPANQSSPVKPLQNKEPSPSINQSSQIRSHDSSPPSSQPHKMFDTEPQLPGQPATSMERNDDIGNDNRNKRKFWGRNNDRHQPMDTYRQDSRDMPYYGMDDYVPSYVPPPIDRPERNDCEIIVVSKTLTEYAEYIEQRLKSMGLIVDLLFPNEDVPIGRVLANISSRGCLYAILVMPQNEEHRSLTLNILHGIPQEHRNMPIDDAIILITRNFDAYMRGEKLEPDELSGSLTEKHPEAVQMLFNLLAENRQLNTSQYERVIKYMQDRMELQMQHEGIENAESTLQPASNNKQAELQSRIMNILNKSGDSPKPPAVPPTPPANNGNSTPLLNDPSVQKALDSLLSGDMFKSISAGI